MAARQNATEATARAMKKGIISVSSPARGGSALVAQASRRGRLLPSLPEQVRCLPPLDLYLDSVPVLGTVDGPTSAVLFCVCSSLVGSECLLIRWCLLLGLVLGQQVRWRLSPAKFSFA